MWIVEKYKLKVKSMFIFFIMKLYAEAKIFDFK